MTHLCGTYECSVGKIQCLVEFRDDGSPLRVSSRVSGRTGARHSTRVIWWGQSGNSMSPTVSRAIELAKAKRDARHPRCECIPDARNPDCPMHDTREERGVNGEGPL